MLREDEMKKTTPGLVIVAVLTLLLLIVSCGNVEENKDEEIAVEPIVERSNERAPAEEPVIEEKEESGELVSPEVKVVVDKARAIKNWHYKLGLGNTEFVICESKMKIHDPSRTPAQGNTFILDTTTKEIQSYRCEANCTPTNCTVPYEDIYQKTPSDYLNEETFVDATAPSYTKEVNGRKTAPVVVETQDQKKLYWFDVWERGGMLVQIQYQDLRTGSTIETVDFTILEANPNNIRDIDCEVEIG